MVQQERFDSGKGCPECEYENSRYYYEPNPVPEIVAPEIRAQILSCYGSHFRSRPSFHLLDQI